jgi:hypothetical protein
VWQALSRPSHPRYSMVWIYCALFCLYWAASCYWFFITVKDAAEMHSVYRDRLGITTRELVGTPHSSPFMHASPFTHM